MSVPWSTRRRCRGDSRAGGRFGGEQAVRARSSASRGDSCRLDPSERGISCTEPCRPPAVRSVGSRSDGVPEIGRRGTSTRTGAGNHPGKEQGGDSIGPGLRRCPGQIATGNWRVAEGAGNVRRENTFQRDAPDRRAEHCSDDARCREAAGEAMNRDGVHVRPDRGRQRRPRGSATRRSHKESAACRRNGREGAARRRRGQPATTCAPEARSRWPAVCTRAGSLHRAWYGRRRDAPRRS